MDNDSPPITKIGSRLTIEDNRLILAEEQKACRARARKLSLENNRRRKAQEERRKAEEARQQKLQEEILQQRRQKLLEATEQHQRAHLPPSQRRRTAQGRPALLLENALKRIEGSFCSRDLQSSFYPGNPSFYRRCHTSSNSPVISSKQRQQRQLSATEVYVKSLQKKSANERQDGDVFFPRKLRERRQAWEERQAHSTQENPKDISQSDLKESLAILDTENSQLSSSNATGHTKTPGLSYSSGPFYTRSLFQSASVRSATSSWVHHSQLLSPRLTQRPPQQCKGEQSPSMSKESLILHEQEKEILSSQPTDSLRTEETKGKPGYENPQAQGDEGGKELQPQPKPEPTSAPEASTSPNVVSDQNTTIQESSVAASEQQTHDGKLDQQLGESDRGPFAVSCGGCPCDDTPPTVFSSLEGGDEKSECIQQVANDTDPYSSCATVNYVSSPTGENRGEKGLIQPSKPPDTSPSTENQGISWPESTFMAKTEQWKTSLSSILSTDVNSNTSISKDCPEDANTSYEINKSDHAEEGISDGLQSSDQDTHRLQSTDSASDPVSPTSIGKSIKGILKKQSKYVPCMSKPTLNHGRIHIYTQAAPSVSDCVERRKTGSKEPERNVKKLRWFDEEHLNVAEERSRTCGGVQGQTGGKCMPSQLQKPSVTAGFANAALVVPPVPSTASHFAHRAWTDSGGQDGTLLESRLEKSSPQRGASHAPRVPRRPGSAPASPRLLSSRWGRGTRPLSAAASSLANQHGAMTQRRVFLPRPPPKKGKSVCHAESLSLSDKACDRSATSDFSTTVTVSGLTLTSFPPSCNLPSSAPQNGTKSLYLTNQRDAPASANGERSLCPNSVSTSQEVYRLWGGIRNTLDPKERNSNFHAWVSA